MSLESLMGASITDTMSSFTQIAISGIVTNAPNPEVQEDVDSNNDEEDISRQNNRNNNLQPAWPFPISIAQRFSEDAQRPPPWSAPNAQARPVCVCVCVFSDVPMCVGAYIHSYIHTWIHTCTQT